MRKNTYKIVKRQYAECNPLTYTTLTNSSDCTDYIFDTKCTDYDDAKRWAKNKGYDVI